MADAAEAWSATSGWAWRYGAHWRRCCFWRVVFLALTCWQYILSGTVSYFFPNRVIWKKQSLSKGASGKPSGVASGGSGKKERVSTHH